MFSHVLLGTNDLERATAFYAPILELLGWRRRPPVAAPRVMWEPRGGGRPFFAVCTPLDGRPARSSNGGMVALLAPDRATVDAAHALALRGGGRDEGAPGLRPQYHPNYYGAYFRDPDGNKVCVCFHGAVDAAPAATPSRRMTRDDLLRAGHDWIEAWNRRDVEAVLAGFAEDVTFRSPLAVKVTGADVVQGKDALRAYWVDALKGITELRFRPIEFICDEASQTLVIHYEAEMGGQVRRACEVLKFREGLKLEGEALYGHTR